MVIAPFFLSAALMQPPHPALEGRRRRGYVQGVVVASYHPAVSDGYHRKSPSLRGTAPAVSVSAGGFLLRSIALEAEFVFGRTVSAPQRFSYTISEDYIAGNRDLLFNELVRYRPRGRAPVEIVVGGGYALTTVSERSIVSRGFTGVFNLPDRSHRTHAATLTAGLDGAVRMRPRVSFTPALRLRWIRRPDAKTSGTHGIARYAVQFGAGLRFW